MSTTPELTPGRPLHELLVLNDSAQGLDELREIAALAVGDLDAEHARVFGKSVAEWASADLAEHLRQAFEADPFTLLARAWAQLRKVRKAVDESRGPPASERQAALLEHSIEARVEPRLVLSVAGVDFCSLRLGVGLKFACDSALLAFNGGRLTALKLCNPSAGITLQCQGQEVARFKRELKVRAAYDFDPPLPWSAADEVAASGMPTTSPPPAAPANHPTAA